MPPPNYTPCTHTNVHVRESASTSVQSPVLFVYFVMSNNNNNALLAVMHTLPLDTRESLFLAHV